MKIECEVDMRIGCLMIVFGVMLCLLACSCPGADDVVTKTVEPYVLESIAAQSSSLDKQIQPETQTNGITATITCEKVTYDLGEIGFGVKNTCEFKFTNTGGANLKITSIRKTCGCTVPQLEKKDYAPGESGVIKVSYTSGKSTASMQKNIFVSTNDPNNSRVTLTIKAKVVAMVEANPPTLLLDPRQANGGIPAIKLTSRDKKPFSIKTLQTTTAEGFTIDCNDKTEASQLLLHPHVDTDKLRQGIRGYIALELTHPQAPTLSIPFEVMSEFKTVPVSLNLLNVKPGQTLTREITLTSNYDEPFEVESVNSQHDSVEILGRESTDDYCKLKVSIKLPDQAQRAFSDVIQVSIKDKDPVTIPYHAIFPGGPTATSARTAPKSLPFKAEPSQIKLQNTEPSQPVTREIWLSCTEGKDFEIKSASSQKGYVKLLDHEKQGDKVRLQIQITPPPSQYRLEVYSDILTLNITGDSDADKPIAFPITCRGAYVRGPFLRQSQRRPAPDSE